MAKDNEPRSRGVDAPMCKICEHRHWSREPHVFGGKKKSLDVAKEKVKRIESSPMKKKPKKSN